MIGEAMVQQTAEQAGRLGAVTTASGVGTAVFGGYTAQEAAVLGGLAIGGLGLLIQLAAFIINWVYKQKQLNLARNRRREDSDGD